VSSPRHAYCRAGDSAAPERVLYPARAFQTPHHWQPATDLHHIHSCLFAPVRTILTAYKERFELPLRATAKNMLKGVVSVLGRICLLLVGSEKR
jgi:hypothetical protein